MSKEGTMKYYQVYGKPVLDANNEVVSLCVSVNNITFLKEAEEKLKKSLIEISDYKFSLDEANLVSLSDASGVIQYVNDNFCKISKYQRHELIGKNHNIFNSGHHSKEFFADLWKTVLSGHVWHGEIKNRAKDGSYYWVDTTIVPFLDKMDKPYQFIGIRTDITELKKTQQQLQQLNLQLEEKVKERTLELVEANEELQAFNYTVSHDLQSPLRTLSSFAKIVLKNTGNKLNDDEKEYLHLINQSAKHMSELISDLLAFAESGKLTLNKQATDMHALVNAVITEIKFSPHAAKAEIIIHPMGTETCDEHLIRQVWYNLINNAVKYSSKKEKPVIEIGTLQTDNKKTYYVKDNGDGFDMKYADNLFNVFKRLHTKHEFEGTGVGLATAHRIITRHGGNIWAEAQKDKGATFYFTLPV